MRRPKFARHARIPFERWIKPRFAGKPIKYLELGVYQGASALWMFENVLTHPECRAVLVDPWMSYTADDKHVYSDDMMRAARAGVFQMHLDNKWPSTIFVDTASNFLLKNCGYQYDLIYHDGAHDAGSVLTDAVLIMKVVKPGGWIVFDDCNEPGCGKAVKAFADVFSERLLPIYATKQPRCYEAKAKE